jgi:phosphatidate phosphatase APP1
METVTQKDGFFKFEWESINSVPAGWHSLKAELLDENNNVLATGEGKVFVPHITQYAFISDIDDTVLISHSATIFKRLRVLFTKNPRSRKAFADVVKHYSLLSRSNAEPDVPNPFFYVSSSEWNLYNDLDDFFRHNQLPPGVFLLNEIKRWYQLFKTGKTKHQGKLTRVARIMEVFPQQQFVLLGDNSQKDPEIYAAIANKYRGRIVAVYIRNISPKKHSATESTLATISNKNIYTCIYNSDEEAIKYSKKIGLINEP